MADLTQLLEAASHGDADAAAALLPVVYQELRRLAAHYLDGEKPGQTLQPTALVHEAYVRLVGVEVDRPWQGRGHFLAAAARAMRNILVENARRKNRAKHGGDRSRVPLGDVAQPECADARQLLALDDALTALGQADPTAAEIVQLHSFGGLSIEDAGAQLGLSRAAAYRQWAFARAWLRCEVEKILEES